MVEGKIDIYLSQKEPDKNLLWLRPYLDKDGYELLYFGADGWTPLCHHKCYDKCYCRSQKPDQSIIDCDTLVEIPDKAIEGVEGCLYEISTPSLNLPETPKPSCGCPDVTIKQM